MNAKLRRLTKKVVKTEGLPWLKFYRKPEECLASYWGLSVKDYLDSSEGLYKVKGGRKGQPKEVPTRTIVEATKDMGYWGYSDRKTRTIHLWIGDRTQTNVTDSELLFFLGHEVGHMTAKQERNLIKKELRANQYGEVVRLTHKLFLQCLAKVWNMRKI